MRTVSYQPEQLTPELIRQRVQVTYQEDGGTVTAYTDSDGEICSTVYQLYPGISLIHKDVHRPNFISNWRHNPKEVLNIEHCREGRIECSMGENMLYLAPGDIVVFRTDYAVQETLYPLNHYHSSMISIDLTVPSAQLLDLMCRAGSNVGSLMKKYRLDQGHFCVLKENAALKRLFSDIYSAPESVKTAYWGIKVQELLLLLEANVPQEDEHPVRCISRTQAAVAKEAHRYLMEHLRERITIQHLAKLLSTSPTQLKEGFRAVYGTSIQTFVRQQRIHASALMLKRTDMKVRDIAELFGYINVSKFSSAFQAVTGMTPTEYREQIDRQTN